MKQRNVEDQTAFESVMQNMKESTRQHLEALDKWKQERLLEQSVNKSISAVAGESLGKEADELT